MQQKERKLAKRKAANKQRLKVAKQESTANLDPDLHLELDAAESEPHRPSHTLMVLNKSFDGILDYDNDRHVGFGYPELVSSTECQPQTTDFEWLRQHEQCDNASPISKQLAEAETEDDMTPELTKLKGTIWPGMDIFDSADVETQRKRNQKKDSSVLKRMQIMSELVEPMETVRSPGGTVKKQRHMDDLEDDSLVEGESPPLKPAPKRQKRASAVSTTTATRNPLGGRRRERPSTQLTIAKPKKHLGHSAVKTAIRIRQAKEQPRISQTKRTLQGSPYLEPRREHIPSMLYDYASIESRMPKSVFWPNPLIYNGLAISPQRTLQTPAIEACHQEAAAKSGLDSIEKVSQSPTWSDPFSIVNDEKENINPLYWQTEAKWSIESPASSSYNVFNGLNGNLELPDNIYSHTRNPLFREHRSPSIFPRTPSDKHSAAYYRAAQNVSQMR